MFICVCIYVYTCMSACTYVHACAHACKHVYTCMHVHIYVCATNTHTHAHTYIKTHICASTSLSAPSMQTKRAPSFLSFSPAFNSRVRRGTPVHTEHPVHIHTHTLYMYIYTVLAVTRDKNQTGHLPVAGRWHEHLF